MMNMYASDYNEVVSILNKPLPDDRESWADTLIYGGYMASGSGTLTCPANPALKARMHPDFTNSYREIYGTWETIASPFPNAVIRNATTTFRGVSLKRVRQSSRFIILIDSYSSAADYKTQHYFIRYNSGSTQRAHAKHQGRMNIGYIGGNVSPASPAEYRVLFNEMRANHGRTSAYTACYYDEGLVGYSN